MYGDQSGEFVCGHWGLKVKSKKGAYFHLHIIKWLGLHHTSCDGGFYYDSRCSLYFLATE